MWSNAINVYLAVSLLSVLTRNIVDFDQSTLTSRGYLLHTLSLFNARFYIYSKPILLQEECVCRYEDQLAGNL